MLNLSIFHVNTILLAKCCQCQRQNALAFIFTATEMKAKAFCFGIISKTVKQHCGSKTNSSNVSQCNKQPKVRRKLHCEHIQKDAFDSDEDVALSSSFESDGQNLGDDSEEELPMARPRARAVKRRCIYESSSDE